MDTHHTHTGHLISAGLILTLCAGAVPAQTSDPMPGSRERVEQAEAVLPRVQTNDTAIMPTVTASSKSVQPGLTEGHDWIEVLSETLDRRVVPSTLAEGTFLLDRLGRLVRGPMDRLIFAPDRAQRQAGEGAMLILPCSIKDQIAASWTGQSVLIRGEVFLYHGRNYLLPAWFSMVAPSPVETPTLDTESPATPIEKVPAEPPASLDDDPEIKALLEELEAEMPSANAPGASIHDQLGNQELGPTRPAQGASTASGIREGTILIRRRGRLDRQADGAWALIFDNDEASDLGAEALTILPCRMLMQMESFSARDGGAKQLIVSGRVYASGGNGYLLPTLVQRVRLGDITPRQ
ncbi:MAG: hypothetical protein JKY96_07805 [Phycisphaerales bacterium]|nr:hypothetical protein [Phycisphaerales bacterium]